MKKDINYNEAVYNNWKEKVQLKKDCQSKLL